MTELIKPTLNITTCLMAFKQEMPFEKFIESATSFTITIVHCNEYCKMHSKRIVKLADRFPMLPVTKRCFKMSFLIDHNIFELFPSSSNFSLIKLFSPFNSSITASLTSKLSTSKVEITSCGT